MNLKKVSAFLLAFLFVMSAIAPFALADVSVFSYWIDTDDFALDVMQGNQPQMSVVADQTRDSMDVTVELRQNGRFVRTLLTVSNWHGEEYFETLTLNTDNLEGSYDIITTVEDGRGEDESVLTLNVQAQVEDNHAPQVSSRPVLRVNEGDDYSYTIQAVDQDGDDLSYSFIQRPQWIGLEEIDNNHVRIHGQAPEVDSDRNYVVSVRISDGEAFIIHTFTITVVNDAPQQQLGSVSVLMAWSEAVGQDHSISRGDDASFVYTADSVNEDSMDLIINLRRNGLFVRELVEDSTNNDEIVGQYVLTQEDYARDGQYTIEAIVSGESGSTDGDELYLAVTFQDDDGDGVANDIDNCNLPNADQVDVDGNGRGDACEFVPEFEVAELQQGSEGMELAFTVRAMDDNNDDLTITAQVAQGVNEEADNIEFTDVGNGRGNFIITANHDFVDHPNLSRRFDVVFTVTDGTETVDGVSQAVMVVPVRIFDVNREPVIVSEAVTEGKENELYVYQVLANDADNDRLTLSLTDNPIGMTITNGLIEWTPTFNDAGNHDVVVLVEDAFGGDAEQRFSIDVENTNRMPTVVQENQEATEGQLFMYQIESNDPDGDDVTFALESGPPGLRVLADGLVQWTPGFDVVQHLLLTQDRQVQVIFTDGDLVDELEFIITVTDVNQNPAITSQPVLVAKENEEYVYQVTGRDFDDDALTFSLAENPVGMIITNGLIEWTPDFSQAGNHEVVVEVDDGFGGEVQQRFRIVVENTNRAPIVNVVNQEVDEGGELRYQIQFEDLDGDAVFFAGQQGPAGLIVFRDGEVTFEPDFDFVTHPDVTRDSDVIVSFTDGDLGGQAQFTITVNDVNRLPVILSEPVTEVNEGELYQYAVVVSDADNDSLVYTVNRDDILVEDNVLTFTPGFNDAGVYDIVITVDDGFDTITQEFQVTVHNVNRAPVLDDFVDIELNEGEFADIHVLFSDADGDQVTVTFSELDGLTDNGDGSAGFSPDFDFVAHPETERVETVTITATDGVDAATQEFVITVHDVNRDPILDAIGNQEVDENELLTFQITATDADADVLLYSAAGLPVGAVFDELTQTFSWTPGFDAAGSYDVTFTVSDGFLVSSETVTIIVNNVNRNPLFDPIADGLVNEGEELSFNIRAADVDNDVLTLAAEVAPGINELLEDISFVDNGDGTGTFSVVPSHNLVQHPANFEVFAVRFTVNDGEVIGEVIIEVTVIDVNRNPVIISEAVVVGNENELYSYEIVSEDLDNDVIDFNLLRGPGGMVLQDGILTWTPTFDDAGDHLVTIEITDGFGGRDEQEFVIDVQNANRIPTINPIDNVEVSEDDSVSIQTVVADADNEALTVTFSNLDGLTDNGDGTTMFTPDFDFVQHPELSREETVTVTVTDGNDSVEETFTITVNDVNRLPVLTLEGSTTVNENEEMSLTLTGADADGDELSYFSTEQPEGSLFFVNGDGTVSFTWTPRFDQSGDYDVTFSVTDGFDTIELNVTLVVVHVSHAPEIFSDDYTVNENELLTFNVDASDINGDQLIIEANDIPFGAAFVDHNDGTGTFTWTPDFTQAGSYDVIFTVFDGEESTSATSTIVVENVNRAPVLDAIGNQQVDEGQLLTLDLSGLDIDNDAIQFTTSALPEGATLVDSVFSWTPGFDQEGNYVITFAVSDGELFDSETITIVVNHVNVAPEFDATVDQQVNENEEITFSVSASDFDGDNVQLSVQDAPEGADFVDNGNGLGVFTWTPTYRQAGEYDVTFTVSDGQLSSDVTVHITVVNVNTRPTIDSNPVRFARENELYQYQVTFADAEDDDVTYTLLDYPAGMTVSNTGLVEWTPEHEGKFFVTLSVTDVEFTTEQTYSIDVREIKHEITFNRVGVEQSVLFPGEPLVVSTEITNAGDSVLEDVRISVNIMELGLRRTIGPFDLSSGDHVSRRVILDMPDVEAGDYYVRVTASNDDINHVSHRVVTVVE